MNILLTNDDGIHAEGIWKLAEAMRGLGNIVIAAPDRDQSGIGTAKSLQNIVKAHEYRSLLDGVRAIMVEGTPADCVILAAESLHTGGFDLVVSGINAGANLGLDIMSSGTVGGALQGYFRNIPSIAVSVTSINDVKFDAAASAAARLAEAVLQSKGRINLPLFLNMNVPNVDADRIMGSEITTLGPRAYMENVEPQQVGTRTHYRIHHNKPVGESAKEGSDIWAIRQSKVSITPLNGMLANVEGEELTREFAASVARAFTSNN
ncbi:MAG: 5'/3'-nucleotidase SurE [Chloroflexi bacterium]|nr:5'/3'-nucleotidase SurE [Chloroflexota bacterium]